MQVLRAHPTILIQTELSLFHLRVWSLLFLKLLIHLLTKLMFSQMIMFSLELIKAGENDHID